ncbi:MAG: hypothetical protein V1850_02625 [Candidatus Bathyarchaeota archaeon]
MDYLMKKRTKKQVWTKKLDDLFRKVIQTRDDSTCQVCGKKSGCQVSHFFSRRRLSVRWDTRNACLMCVHCHLYWFHRDIGSASKWLHIYLGEKNYQNLWTKAQVVKAQINYEQIYKDLLGELDTLKIL